MIGIAFKKARSFFLDRYRCDSRSWALNCCDVSFWFSLYFDGVRQIRIRECE
jgi:hypothetical protein